MDGKRDKPGTAEQREHLDALLDDALAQTFPASDPVAIAIADRPAPSPANAGPSIRPAPAKRNPAKTQS